MAENNNTPAGFRKLMRYAENLAEYEKGKSEGIIDDNVFVIVLEEQLFKFKGKTGHWPAELGGGGLEIREFYIGDFLTDEQKAWNLETAQAILDKKAIVICNGSILGDGITTNNDGSKEFINSVPTPQGVLYAGVKVEEDGTASVFSRQLYLDDKLSDKSINAVQNKVITAALNNKADKSYVDNAIANAITNTLNTEV